jgi:alkylation response protein AidB-like acyl-CoA dehydrogenase
MHEFAEIDFTEEDRAVRALAAELVAREVAPRAREIDEKELFPRDALRVFGDAGLVGILVPEEFGGSGGTMLQYCIVLEEISTACGATAATFMTQVHGMLPIVLAGSDEQKKQWLSEAATGQRVTAIALTEPQAGSDVAGMRTAARRDGDGYRISGSKIFITNGNEADIMCVFARTDPDDRHGGISLFVLDTKSDGVSFGPPLKKMGIRGSDTAEVFFDDVFVPQSQRLGGEGIGFPIAMGALGDARISTAAQAVGLARGAWDRAFAYARQREQFGRVIYDFQAVQLRLMELFSQVVSGRLMVYQLARMIDHGLRSEYSVEASMAKSYCSDMAMEVTTRAVDVLGGYGYMREYEIERFMRDAKITQIYDGTNDINRMVMARQIVRRSGAAQR